MFYSVLCHFCFLVIDLLALAKTSIGELFDDSTNPTRLAQPSGGVEIKDAIATAERNLNTFKSTNGDQKEVPALTQAIGFAKGLNMLSPYFTDLSMNTPSSDALATADLPSINNTINNLGLGNSKYLQTLSGLMRLLVNATQGRIICFIKTSSICPETFVTEFEL